MASNDPKRESSSSPNENRLSVNSTTTDGTPSELSAVVDELLSTLSNKFAGVASEMFAKMDEMSRRLDNMEAALQSGGDSKGSPVKK